MQVLATLSHPHCSNSVQVVGLSKFNRIVHHICERPQIQEEMTTQIADALRDVVKTSHMCAGFSYLFVSVVLTTASEPLL